MATGSSPTARLARAITHSNTATPAILPRLPQVSMHQGWVTRVDTFNGVIDFQFPDPSGVILPSVRYIQPYGADNVPSVTDTVWGMCYGSDFIVLGQHVTPSGTVTFG